jgi:hypothetical protein
MKSFLRAATITALFLFGVLIYLQFLQQRSESAGGLPVIQELTNTFQSGFHFAAEVADFVLLKSSYPPPATIGASPPYVAAGTEDLPPRIPLTWTRERVEQKLRDKGFRRGKLRAAGRYLDYIEKYRNEALLDMYHTGVPASITLAQGILESNAGQSRLARKTNNHFGIKARQRASARQKIRAGRFASLDDTDFSVSRPAVGVSRHHDDHHYDRFEVYRSVQDSYRRHSALLTRSCRGDGIYKGCYRWIWAEFPVSETLVDLSAAARRFERVSGIPAEQFFPGKARIPYFAAQAAGLKMAGYATAPTYHRQITFLIETYELWRFDIDLVQVAGQRRLQ